MSHEVETMAWKGEMPWHGLGNKVSNGMNVKAFQKAAGITWDVEAWDMYRASPEGGRRIKSEKKVLVRNDNGDELTIITPDWKPVQNSVAFEFFHDWCKEGKMELETAGSLYNGKMIWVLAKTRQSISPVKGDQTDNYMLFTLPHIYGQATTVRSTAIRVVCHNTLTMALNAKSDLRVAVTHHQEFDPEVVKAALKKSQMKLDAYNENAKFLASQRYKMDDVTEFASLIFKKTKGGEEEVETEEENDKISRNARKIIEVLETQPGANFAAGTWWQAFNAVTFTIDHLVGRNRESALWSSWYGVNATRKQTALRLATEYATKSQKSAQRALARAKA